MKTTPLHKLIEIAEEGGNEATRPNWRWKQKISELVEEEKDRIVDAFDTGFKDTGLSFLTGEKYYQKTFGVKD